MIPSENNGKTVHLGYYFLAFIDVVGQREKLKQLTALPKNETERQEIAKTLVETSEYIKELRKQFASFFNQFSQSMGGHVLRFPGLAYCRKIGLAL